MRDWLIRKLGGVTIVERDRAADEWRDLALNLADRLEAAGLLTIVRDNFTRMERCDVDGALLILSVGVIMSRCRFAVMPMIAPRGQLTIVDGLIEPAAPKVKEPA